MLLILQPTVSEHRRTRLEIIVSPAVDLRRVYGDGGSFSLHKKRPRLSLRRFVVTKTRSRRNERSSQHWGAFQEGMDRELTPSRF
jgi:hypothetical protein